jgi:hypothetical protein
VSCGVGKYLPAIKGKARDISHCTFERYDTIVVDSAWFFGEYDSWSRNEETGLPEDIEDQKQEKTDYECTFDEGSKSEAGQGQGSHKYLFH